MRIMVQRSDAAVRFFLDDNLTQMTQKPSSPRPLFFARSSSPFGHLGYGQMHDPNDPNELGAWPIAHELRAHELRAAADCRVTQMTQELRAHKLRGRLRQPEVS